MDGIAVGFVILMVALGGLSAYVADILGYKIGKKRLSIWRIRPKYVARTSVVVAGMLIPLITISVLYAASADFRTWLTKGRQAIEESKIKSAELEKLQVELRKKAAEISNQIRVFQADSDKKQREVNEKQSELLKLDASAKKQAQELKTIQTQKAQLELTYNKVQTSLKTAQQSLKTAQASLTATNIKLKEVDSKLSSTLERYKEATDKYNDTTRKNLALTVENGSLQRSNEDFSKVNAKLQTDILDLGKSIESLQNDKMKAEAEAKAAKGELASVREAIADITEKISQLKAQYASDLKENNSYVRTNAVTFGIGEELGRISIPSKVSLATATNLYRTLMRKAKAIATARGAAPDTEFYPFSDNVGFIATDANGNRISEQEVDRYFIQQFLNVPQDSVAVVRASNNRVGNEPVTLTLTTYANPIVFLKDEIIAESKIDGKGTELEIRKTIREFLRTYVNTKARGRKMIPVQTRDGETFGEFSEEQYFNAAVQAKKIPRLLRLVAVASTNTRAGDPLVVQLEFR